MRFQLPTKENDYAHISNIKTVKYSRIFTTVFYVMLFCSAPRSSTVSEAALY